MHCFMVLFFKPRVRFFDMIRITISDPRSFGSWKIKPCPEWIHWFIWSNMIRVISDHWSWSGYPKGTHPQKSPDCCPLEWNSSWVKLSCTRFSIYFQRNMRFILNLTLQKVSLLCPFVSAEGGKVNDNAFTEVCSHYLLFLFFSINFSISF